jgi:hypothetical protein
MAAVELGNYMTSTHLATRRFALDDAVRLLECHGDVLSGSVGRVLGAFPHPTGTTYAVSFVEAKVSVLALRSHEIVLVDDFRAAA